MSQFIYVEVITAAVVFHICLHPDPHDAFSSGLCSVVPRNVTTGEEEKGGRSAVGAASIPTRRGPSSVSAASLRAPRWLGPTGKPDARAAPRPLMPSSCLPSARMHVLIRALLYLYHHQAFGALHQHQVFALTCACRLEIVESVVLLCSRLTPVCVFGVFFYRFLPLSNHFCQNYSLLSLLLLFIKLSSFPRGMKMLHK